MDLKEICVPIQNEVNQLKEVVRSHLSSNISFVGNVADYVTQNEGKRIRPILTILSAKLAGYQQSLEPIKVGAAIEFLHTASLLHDDVIDNAPLRRGRDSVNKKWGNHVCVLVGDFFYCRAMDLLVGHGDLRVLRAITDAVTITTEGEIFEITKSNDLNISEDDYLQIIYSKTAALIEASCYAGAIIGDVSKDFEESLSKFGRNLGIAFQLMDDVLDYTASIEEFGKENGIDLKEGKLTLPLILALKRCTEKETSIIKNALISDKLDSETFHQVYTIIEKYNGLRDTSNLAQSYINKAKENLARFKPSLEKETLDKIADYVVLRRQ